MLGPNRSLALRSFSFAVALAFVAFVSAQSVSDFMSQADTAYNKKDYAKSIDLYKRAIKIDPKQTLAAYNLACCYALLGDSDKAFEALESLVASGYNNPDRLAEDTDFESVRKDPRWVGIVDRAKENAKKNPPRKRFVKPYQILELPADTSSIVTHLGTEDSVVWVEGDVLSFLHKSDAKVVRTTGGIQEPMSQIPGSDLWLLQLRMSNWDRALDSYGFVDDNKPVQLKLWKGASAPELVNNETPLQGKVLQRVFHSLAINEDRTLTIYLPPNAPKTSLPAVFMADGQACKDFAHALEPLILAGQVRPCAIIGIPSGEYKGDRSQPYDGSKDLRALDYVPGMDPDRFERHLTFFTDEVGAFVAKEYGISTKRADLAVTGYSNGGAFSAAVAFHKPKFFGVAIPLSLGIPPLDGRPSSPLPRMYFAAGSLESFSASTTQVYELVRSWGVESSLDIYVAGHDPAMWSLAFRNVMPKVFPVRK